MTLPASGPLSLNDIQGEFGGTNPIGMNEYYAGGGLVPSGTTGTFGAVPSSGALSVQNFYGTSQFVPIYIEDVFSTFLYNGNGATQTITNGIDLAGKGGLVWAKARSSTGSHILTSSGLASGNRLSTDTTNPAFFNSDITGFTSSGFTLGQISNFVNRDGITYVSWTFREQPKFFDVVTWTGNGAASQQISHSLGSVPGFIAGKRTSSAWYWINYHRSLGSTQAVFFNQTQAAVTSSVFWNNTDPTSSAFTVGSELNAAGETFVAYLFAHNAGGFGLTGTDNVISCGSFTTNGSGGVTGDVTLGYEPQWLLVKQTTTADNWYLWDTMRGLSLTNIQGLYPNLNAAEGGGSGLFPTATGFAVNNGTFPSSATFIYIAIRRGPMKVPTVGTSVFSVQTYTGDDSTRTLTTGFPVDLAIGSSLSSSAGNSGTFSDRLRGTNRYMNTASSGAEVVGGNSLTSFAIQNGVGVNGPTNYVYNFGAIPYVLAALRRAPGFFDEVCYTGTGAASQTLSHNLTVAPELMIVKSRTISQSWVVYVSSLGNTSGLLLNGTNATLTGRTDFWSSTTPTSTVFSIGDALTAAGTYVAYLFASAPGVSKVGSYTGTGATQVINCGFTGGARFVLIKSTSTTGDWYVWDSARGIVAGNDPYLRWNVNGNQVTNTDWVDTAASGFELSNSGGNLANSNGVSYIFLAIS